MSSTMISRLCVARSLFLSIGFGLAMKEVMSYRGSRFLRRTGQVWDTGYIKDV
ncbi:MAG: hypothetical protein JWN98_2387 [Abditibacteriota bacterium]|nr:hypothetical protein [Abditibacteriota bacterium]